MHADLIVPVLIRADGVDPSAKREQRHITEPFARDLLISYAIDLETGLVPLTEAYLARLGLTVGSLWALGRFNLTRRRPRVIAHWSEDLATVDVELEGGLASSLMLDPGRMARFSEQLGGPLISAIPHRDRLLLASVERPRGVRRVRRTAEEAGPTGLSDEPLRYQGGGRWRRVETGGKKRKSRRRPAA